MRFSEMRNAADPYFDIQADGSVVIRGEALEALDECMDDADFGNVVRFSLMVALISRDSGVAHGVRISKMVTEATSVIDDAVAGKETAEHSDD